MKKVYYAISKTYWRSARKLREVENCCCCWEYYGPELFDTKKEAEAAKLYESDKVVRLEVTKIYD